MQEQQVGYQAAEENGMRRRRFINSSSFATDGELSTFSEEDNDGSDMPENIISGGANGVNQSSSGHAFYRSHEQRSPLSIFRSPVSGSKRQRSVYTVDSDDMMDDDEPQGQVDNVTAPLLLRANRICSDDETSDDDSSSLSSDESLDHIMSTPSAKRICLSRSDSPSSYVSLFALASPATLDHRGNDSAIITPRKLDHPLSGGTLIEN